MTKSWALGVWLIVCVLGCGDKGQKLDDDAGVADAGQGDPNEVEPGELCERLSTLQCEGEAKCCDAPGRDYDECKQAMLEGCVKTLRLDDVAMKKEAGFDAARAKAAFEGFEQLVEDCDPGIAEWGSSVDGLRGMLQGSVDHDAYCPPRGPINDTAVVGAALASCKDPSTHACQPRTTRLSGMPDWTCDEKSADGGDCFSDDNCAAGLYCDNPKQLFGAKCRARKDEGEACTYANACESLACRDGKCAATSTEAAYCLAE